jgi:hypothetical protein
MTNTVMQFGVLMFLAAAGARAQTTVYKCTDAEGRVMYTDSATQKGCKAIDIQGAISQPARGAAPNPASAPAPSGAMRQGAGRPPAASPANFPKVEGYVQRQRDDDRRDILNDELRNEEKKLADLRREFNNGEPERQGNEKNYAKYQERVERLRGDIGRSEKNVEALKREIGNIR